MFPRSPQHRQPRLHKNLLITISAKKGTRKRKEVHDITAVQESSNTCHLPNGFKISGGDCHGGWQRGIKYNIKVGWRKGHYHFSSPNNTCHKPHQYFPSSQPWRNMGLHPVRLRQDPTDAHAFFDQLFLSGSSFQFVALSKLDMFCSNWQHGSRPEPIQPAHYTQTSV